jgi:hypothetical protein
VSAVGGLQVRHDSAQGFGVPGVGASEFGLSGPVSLGGEGLGDAAQAGAGAVQFADAIEGGLLLVVDDQHLALGAGPAVRGSVGVAASVGFPSTARAQAQGDDAAFVFADRAEHLPDQFPAGVIRVVGDVAGLRSGAGERFPPSRRISARICSCTIRSWASRGTAATPCSTRTT